MVEHAFDSDGVRQAGFGGGREAAGGERAGFGGGREAAGAAPVTRRALVAGAAGAAAAAALAAAGGSAAAAPLASQASAAPAASAAVDEGQAWDAEADFVVVGTGIASAGAFAAAKSGASVISLEKGSIVGGTTIMSGCVCWVPGNDVMEGLGYGPDVSDEEVLAYLRAADVTHAGEEALQRDYVANARHVFRWFADEFGLRLGIFPATCDYYDLPGAMGLGRSIGFADSQVDERNVGMDEPFAEVFLPLYDELGIDLRIETRATRLVTDASGRVVGVVAQDEGGNELRIRADKGVLLGAGGFEHDGQMRDRFLQGPLLGLVSPRTNTGDAIKMGQRVGADLGNMGSIWGNPFYIVDEGGAPEDNVLGDYGMYAGLPGAIYVNAKGRRYVNEAAGYDVVTNAMYNYSTPEYGMPNLRGWMVFDADHVARYGFPGFSEEQPEWTRGGFDTLDELAQACGIDAAGLADEVARFNEMAEAGVDEDFGRGAWLHDTLQAESMGVPEGLANAALGPVATAPFYAVEVGPGAFGTNGGLRTDARARVLDVDGEPIPGLYACGNCSAGIFGSIYPGPGATVGAGFYQALRAADDALGIGIVSAE